MDTASRTAVDDMKYRFSWGQRIGHTFAAGGPTGHCRAGTEGKMSDLEMKDEVEIEEFTDELSDEALDRDVANKFFTLGSTLSACRTPAVPVPER